jgi:hypothetical protein
MDQDMAVEAVVHGRVWRALAVAAVVAVIVADVVPAAAGSPFIAKPLPPGVAAPFRFNPPAKPLTALEQQKALQYQDRLQKRVFDFEREPGPLGVLQDEQLRRSRSEIDRLNQILVPE